MVADGAVIYERWIECKPSYRMVVLRKTIRVMEGQKFLFHEPKYFFYITNLPKRMTSAANGFLDIPPAIDPDPDSGSATDLSPSVVDTSDRTDVAAARLCQSATAPLTRNEERKVTSEFRARSPLPFN